MVDAEAIREEAEKGMKDTQSLLEVTGDLRYLNTALVAIADRFERIFLEAGKSGE